MVLTEMIETAMFVSFMGNNFWNIIPELDAFYI